MAGVFEWVSGSFIAQALIASPVLYIFVNAAHILAIGLLVGAILPLDLRMLGCFRRFPLAVLGPFLSRSAMAGVVLAIVTGVLLFSVNANAYAKNPAFLVKLGLLATGIANALLLHVIAPWRGTLEQGSAPAAARALAVLSMVIWVAAVVAGRWIGFV